MPSGHQHLSLTDPSHPNKRFSEGDIVWLRFSSPYRLCPVALGRFTSKCVVEFIPLYTFLSPDIPTPQVYPACSNHIVSLVSRAELEFLVANPTRAEFTREALLLENPRLSA